MKDTTIAYVFGRRETQDLPEYSSGSCDSFVFTVSVAGHPSSWDSAYALLGYFRADFIEACIGAGTSSALLFICDRETWIPSCYLDRPTIEVNGEELLVGGEKPNPWLSLA